MPAWPSPCSTHRRVLPSAVMRCTFSTSSNHTGRTADNHQGYSRALAFSTIGRHRYGPGIPLRHFWHFLATKERARFCRHAKNFFQVPPCHFDTTDDAANGFAFCVLPSRLALPGQQHPCTIMTTAHGILLHTAARIVAAIYPGHPVPCVRSTNATASPGIPESRFFGRHSLNLPTPPPAIRVYFLLDKRAAVISDRRIPDAYSYIGRRFESPRITFWND